MSSLIRDRTATSADMLAIFSDRSLLDAALRYEAALAGALAAEGLIPADAAARIRALCRDADLDPALLAEQAAHAGTLAIPLAAHLRERAGEDAAHIHRGGTSQDLADTALMLQARDGAALIDADLARLADILDHLARSHADTPMLGRTLLQPALPITFGLKAAQWLLAVRAALARLRRETRAGLALQFGGAAGTRAGLDGRGEAIAARIAAELGLADAPPWHARRDGVAGIACALAIVTGALGKIARDIALLAQAEIAELAEPRVPGRGGSSAMPHKRNPTGCQVALSAAARAPGLLATIVGAMPQELERGLGGWQAEAPALADLFCLAHGATRAMLPVLEALELDATRMARNLDAAGVGHDTGESAAMTRRAIARATIVLARRIAGSARAPTLLLLHPLGGDADMWAPQIEALRPHLHLIALDLRGHGASAAPPGPYALDELGADVLAALDHAGISRAHVCGISLGGLLAQWLAIEHPDRVDHLVLANTAACIGSVQSWREREDRVRADGMPAIAQAVIERSFTPPFRQAHPDIARNCVARLLSTAADGYAACCAALRTADLTGSLARIASPTLVIAGRQDPATPPEQSKALAAAIPGARLLILEAAHLSNLEQPDAFTEALRQHLEVRCPET